MFSVHNFWASQVKSYPIVPDLLHRWRYLMPFCFLHAFICFWGQFSLHKHSVWVAMTCSKLALRTVIMSFERWLFLLKVIAYIHIFSIILVWCRSDLFNVSLQIAGYVSLHNQMPLHITLCKLVFTSPCIYCILPSVISVKHWCHFACMILMHLL